MDCVGARFEGPFNIPHRQSLTAQLEAEHAQRTPGEGADGFPILDAWMGRLRDTAKIHKFSEVRVCALRTKDTCQCEQIRLNKRRCFRWWTLKQKQVRCQTLMFVSCGA